MSTAGVLIIVELGAEWPRLALGESPKARRVLAQDELESPAAFALRAGEQQSSAAGSGAATGSVILACNERLDEHAQGARAALARTAAQALAAARGGLLVLSAADRNDGRSRQVLASLVASLAKEWQSSGVSAVLRFGDEDSVAPAPAPPPKRSSVSRGPGRDARRVA
jgi:hypothetical protein